MMRPAKRLDGIETTGETAHLPPFETRKPEFGGATGRGQTAFSRLFPVCMLYTPCTPCVQTKKTPRPRQAAGHA